jgi:hypothetical protein
MPPGRDHQEINTSLMNMLLESGRIVDEKQSQRPNQRKHSRYDCLVGVDYDISDWTYQCYMRDISEGGAYIETEQPIKVGQRLTMSLASPVLERLRHQRDGGPPGSQRHWCSFRGVDPAAKAGHPIAYGIPLLTHLRPLAISRSVSMGKWPVRVPLPAPSRPASVRVEFFSRVAA